MRYQEWWYEMFPYSLRAWLPHMQVISLGREFLSDNAEVSNSGMFTAVEQATIFETAQIREYINLPRLEGGIDVVLQLDFSFPGLFADALHIRPPDYAFAIAHATALNRYDFWKQPNRHHSSKCKIERARAYMYDAIFVASAYHKDKLDTGWNSQPNVVNLGALPMPPPDVTSAMSCHNKTRVGAVSVSRNNPQKRNKALETRVQLETGVPISVVSGNIASWSQYYNFVGQFASMIITSREETYGYQVVDALLSHTTPIAPNAMSYPELLPKECLYNSEAELMEMIKNPPPCPRTLKNADDVMGFWDKLTEHLA